MLDRGETHILLEQTVDAPAGALFAVLVDPRRHAEIDGSGMVRGSEATGPLTAAGEVFAMAMHRAELGDYRTDNHVVAFEPDRRIAWATARAGRPPVGVVWSWELRPLSDGRTRVTHRYDWSDVTDPEVLARVSFPRVQPDELRATVRRLVEAARATPPARIPDGPPR